MSPNIVKRATPKPTPSPAPPATGLAADAARAVREMIPLGDGNWTLPDWFHAKYTDETPGLHAVLTKAHEARYLDEHPDVDPVAYRARTTARDRLRDRARSERLRGTR